MGKLGYTCRMKWLVVGLGNPEGKYFQTWHNLGFLTVDKLAEEFGLDWKKKGNQMIAKGDGFLLLKPLTYMNRSGEAVVAVVRKHKIAPEKIIVVADDLYIDKGMLRLTLGGGHGGHNGLRNLTELLGTPGYVKVRIGIKPVREPHNKANYVLERIPAEERAEVAKTLERAAEAVRELLTGTAFDRVQCKYNVRNSGKEELP